MFGGEAQQMAHLQHALMLGGEDGQTVGFLQGCGDGFFHQHVAAGLQGGGGEGEMRLGRGGDHHGVTRSQQGRPVQSRGAEFGRHAGGAGRIAVVNADQFGARIGRDLLTVEAAKMAGPCHAHP